MAYDLTQTIMLLNMAANRASSVDGTSQSLTELLTLAMNQGGTWNGRTVSGFLKAVGPDLIGGDWQIVWGPIVYVHGDDKSSDNAMYVAYSASQDMYVVAIAATDPISVFDWIAEDANIYPGEMVNAPLDPFQPLDRQYVWPNWFAPQFDGGTALGVYTLCNDLIDPAKGSIAVYLAEATKTSSTRLVFTGHSLAGALAPALAFQLRDALAANWNASLIYVLPSAGATPGNALLSYMWGKFFPPFAVGNLNSGNQINQLNTLYWNTLDVVPHAWTQFKAWYSYDPNTHTMQTNLGTLDSTTDSEILNDFFVGALGTAYVDDLARVHNASFTGTWPVTYWNGSAWVPYSAASSYASLEALLVAEEHAHTDMYYQLFNVPRDAVPPVFPPP
ncbi:MAG TPA: hypothetical protein VG889_12840 [Rhizomicrobium sp.]|nr:hypothetical protein [Rhizomicrobium sp.]